MKKTAKSIIKGIDFRLGILNDGLDALLPKMNKWPQVIFDYQARIDELTTLRAWALGEYDKKKSTIDKKKRKR